MVLNVFLAILVLSIIVIVHEFGHFIIAKANGITVVEFSIGFGPKLIHFRKGETEYCIKALPFGGACTMLGDEFLEMSVIQSEEDNDEELTDEEKEAKKEKRKPTPADAAVDYVAYLMETEDQEEEEKPSRTISLIDDFMEDGGFKLPKIQQGEEYKPEYTPQLEDDNDNEEQTEIVVYLQKPSPASTSNRASMNELIKLSSDSTSSIHTRVPTMWTS